MTLTDSFKIARLRSVPLISISTQDPTALIAELSATQPEDTPILRWTLTTGLEALSPTGAAALAKILDGREAAIAANPVESLTLARDLPKNAVLFMLQAHRYLEGEGTAIAVWHLRDLYKRDGRTLVLLSPGMIPPPELAQDIISLDEPLPDAAQLSTIVREMLSAAKNTEPAEQVITDAVAALTGLSAFQAEQVTAMSLKMVRGKPAELDMAELWTRKRRTISDTPGLTVYGGPEKFADIGGQANLKQFLSRILAGDRAPKTVVIIDEIEKALGGAGTDTSGVSTDQLAVLLTAMQDKKAAGILLMGPPGAGKTVVAKAAANEASALGIMFDLGGMKSSLVGSSEQRIRSALRVIDAVSSGLPLFIATCNSVAALPPELLRRFNLARFFVDLPTPDERKSIWGIHRKKYAIDPKDPGPASDSQWTGAEIENACDIARRLNQPLNEAAKYIVPIAKSAEATISRLRQQAGGHFISASEPGPYLYVDPKLTEVPAGGRRQLSYELEDSK